MESTPQNIQHLYNRAGFGWSVEARDGLHAVAQHVNTLFANSATSTPIALITKDMLPQKRGNQMTASEKKELQKQAREFTNRLNIAWLNQMHLTREVLREKMTFFWHGHFACHSANPFFLQELNNIHRRNALGNFKTLLVEVSKSAAMLEYLNNQQNKKEHPNENFARELMELFTLGRGNYTEDDIKESARAFTGWGFNAMGDFEFRPKHHDFGPKKFMGRVGNFQGEEIIDMILEKRETAVFIRSKLYRFLVNDVVAPHQVEELAKGFYDSGYQLAPLVSKILEADWFYSPVNKGAKIKSPVELLVGLNRLFGVQYEDPLVLMKFQRLMGQVLFFPPNVSGWSGGKNWIDSSSLMFRMKLPSVVLNDGLVEEEPKDDPEHYERMMEQVHKIQNQVHKMAKASVNWADFLSHFGPHASLQEVANFLLPVQPAPHLMDTIEGIAQGSTRGYFLAVTALPEFQIC